DAPVSGGDVGAKHGTLAIMVGGEEDVFKDMMPIFNILGENIVWHGQAGAGQHAKLANQITIASNMIGVCEAIIYAKKSSLDPSLLLDTITTCADGSCSLLNLAPSMNNSDFSPGFYGKYFIKYKTISLEAAKEMRLETPGLKLSLSLYEELASM